MKKCLLTVLLITLICIGESFGQCKTDLLIGQNIVRNGDFSQNYTDWTYTQDSDGDIENSGPDGYQIYTGSPRNYSIPGNIYVGTGSDMYTFNQSFNKPFTGHTTGAADDKFLMVDGVCVTDIKLWSQSNIPVIPLTRYYFSVWINSLKDQPNYPGLLKFDVDGFDLVDASNLVTIIQAPNLGGASVGGKWIQVEAYWDSGLNPPPTVTISIEGNQTIGCGGNSGESDFVIDDISFIPGCGYSDNGPVPNLGVDRTLCGTSGSVTIDPGVPHTDSTLVTWSANAPGVNSGLGMGAPYSKIITAPGTYSVCVTAGSACTKSDIIVVTNTFTPNTTPDADLCGIPTAPLDAVFTGIGVTYQWKLNGSNLPAPSTNRTYGATTTGTYTVDVFTPGCGSVTSGNTVITSAPTSAPTRSPDGNLCSTNPVPLDAVLTGTGITYQWKLNGANLPAPSTNRTYSAFSAGNYTVDVKLPGCAITTSAITEVKSTSPVTPVDAFYCANTGSAVSATLGATGTNSANFKWYTSPVGGSSVHTGPSYMISIPDVTTLPQIFYVQDETITNGTVGPTTLTGTDQGFYAGGLGNIGQYFTATQNLKINSIQIPIKISANKGPMSISFDYTVYKVDPAGNNPTALSVPISGTTNTVIVPGTTAAYTMFTFNTPAINITDAMVAANGTTYLLRITAKTISAPYGDNDFQVDITDNPSYPYASSLGTGVGTITSSYVYGNRTDRYGGLYNWAVSATTPCSRIPVRAISNCVTPVTWTSFYLVPQNNACKLVWNTANETNNAYFMVQRSSDGISFETLDKITGAGNRDIASNYYYIDSAPLSGTSYYRILQVDYDGTTSSTDIKAYSAEGKIQLTTYPNPFQNNTNLMVSGPNAETYTYTLYAVSGQLVEQGTGTINQVQTIAEIQSKGMYMLTVITASDIITTKIVKQ